MKAELRILFFSPIAWLILIVFAVQSGLSFTELYQEQLRFQSLGYPVYNATLSLIGGVNGLFTEMLSNLYLYIPLLTMGMISRELNSGSIKLLYSSPISDFEIILGKYLSALVYGFILILLLAIPVVYIFFNVKDADMMMMFVALLGVYLTICTYSAIGLFMSCITKYPVVAVVSTFIVLAFLNFVGELGQEIDFVRDITYWLSISGRSKPFLSGLVCTKDIFYFMMVIVLFLSFSVIKLSGERLKRSILKSTALYALVLILALSVGVITSRPQFINYYDATKAKQNTLTNYSQEILNRLPGKLIITTYTNRLDDTWYHGSPSNKNRDLERFSKYTRFLPDAKLEYVYYYGPGRSRSLSPEDYNLTYKERIEKLCKMTRENPSSYISSTELFKTDNLSLENGRFTRVLSCENGKKALLRIYEDQYIYPSETEITAAIKTLVDPSPIVGFVYGHNERRCYDLGESGYAAFSTQHTARHALVNQGFTVKEIFLNKPVPETIDIMVIADVKLEFTEEELKNYNDYLSRGGNLILFGEPKRQVHMNPLIERFGLKFSEGMVVTPTNLYDDNIVYASINLDNNPLQRFVAIGTKGYGLSTPSVCAIEIVSDKGYNVTKLMQTADKGSWNEVETTDFVNEKSKINEALGEVEKSSNILLYLTKTINSKEQRIFVCGDADCASSKEFSANRTGLHAANFDIISDMFYYLTYEEYPIDIKRERSPDDRFTAEQESMLWIKIGLIGVIPIILLTFGTLFLMARKRK